MSMSNLALVLSMQEKYNEAEKMLRQGKRAWLASIPEDGSRKNSYRGKVNSSVVQPERPYFQFFAQTKLRVREPSAAIHEFKARRQEMAYFPSRDADILSSWADLQQRFRDLTKIVLDINLAAIPTLNDQWLNMYITASGFKTRGPADHFKVTYQRLRARIMSHDASFSLARPPRGLALWTGRSLPEQYLLAGCIM